MPLCWSLAARPRVLAANVTLHRVGCALESELPRYTGYPPYAGSKRTPQPVYRYHLHYWGEPKWKTAIFKAAWSKPPMPLKLPGGMCQDMQW